MRAGRSLLAMELHPLAQGFADVADDYERGRPGYPAGAITAIGLPAGAKVADVGAGTGKLTRALLAGGLDVVAVEPLDGLRARLMAETPGLEALAGTAEALPLPGASVDGVACGDSFHWFDGPRAAPELARVLRPGGVLALLAAGPPAGTASTGSRGRPPRPRWRACSAGAAPWRCCGPRPPATPTCRGARRCGSCWSRCVPSIRASPRTRAAARSPPRAG